MSGVVLGFVVLVWVATRPSQSPEARMLGPETASSQETLPLTLTPSQPRQAEPARPSSTVSATENLRPQGRTIAPEPEVPDVASALFDGSPAPQPQERQVQSEPDTTRYEQPERITTTRFHIVQRGETLSSISQQYYGSAHRWQRIVEANKDAIADANKISPGTKLIIPD